MVCGSVVCSVQCVVMSMSLCCTNWLSWLIACKLTCKQVCLTVLNLCSLLPWELNRMMKERMNKWVSEWQKVRKTEWMNEWLNAWLTDWMNEGMEGDWCIHFSVKASNQRVYLPCLFQWPRRRQLWVSVLQMHTSSQAHLWRWHVHQRAAVQAWATNS